MPSLSWGFLRGLDDGIFRFKWKKDGFNPSFFLGGEGGRHAVTPAVPWLVAPRENYGKDPKRASKEGRGLRVSAEYA